MKLHKIIFLMFAMAGFSVTTQAQITADQITVKVNKDAGKLEVIKKADNTNITASFTLNMANIDIFDSSGEYAGSIELKDKNWTIPVDQFMPGEIVKVASITFTENATGNKIELKDIRLEI